MNISSIGCTGCTGYVIGYLVIVLAVATIHRGYQHATLSREDDDLRQLWVWFTAIFWPVFAVLTVLGGAWWILDRVIRWVVAPRPKPEPERVEDPKAGYRDQGKR